MTITQISFSRSVSPSFVIAWTNIQIQNANVSRASGAKNSTRKNSRMPRPMNPRCIIDFLSVSSLVLFVVAFTHCPLQGGHLLQQFLELHAGQTLQHRRQLTDDLRHVASQLARAAARSVAAIDNDDLFGF